MKKLKYVYLVSYIYKQGSESGTGSVVMYRQNKIDCESEVNSLAEYITEKYNNDYVGITNFILLNKRGK